MSEPRDVIDRATRSLRQSVEVDPAAKQRLVAALRQTPPPRIGPVRRAWRWTARPRPVMISPLAGLAAAAVIALVALLRPTSERDGAPMGFAEAPVPESTVAAPDAVPASTQGTGGTWFRLAAPGAASVSLVGDFNDWDPGRHPLRPSEVKPGVWEVWVPLEPGRHEYSFFVDGSQWMRDPSAARAVEGDVGAPSSVILVGEISS